MSTVKTSRIISALADRTAVGPAPHGLAIAALLASLATGALAQPPKPGAATVAPAPEAAVPPEAGVWIDDTGRGAVEITPCGGKLCGNVVWLQQPLARNGKPQTDELNPDKSRRTQPVCGLQVIGNLVQQKDGTWDTGWVYDPKTGDRFDLAIKLKNPDTLTVTGYVGVKFLSEDFTWKRAPANPPLPRCDTQSATIPR